MSQFKIKRKILKMSFLVFLLPLLAFAKSEAGSSSKNASKSTVCAVDGEGGIENPVCVLEKDAFECEDCKSEEPLDIQTCNMVSHKRNLMNGRLSDYWAQELIGSDLLREELESLPPPSEEHWIAVVDFFRHGVKVKNLISDEGPHAVLPNLANKAHPFFQSLSGSPSDEPQYNKKINPSEYGFNPIQGYLEKEKPHFINQSLTVDQGDLILEDYQEFSPSSIVVAAAGNDFPSGLSEREDKASKNSDVIVVGSFSPRGFVSVFSQSGGEVHIMAPSDQWISSAGKSGEYQKFGGTSGAAPLVTGSLAGFEWLSGYHPTPKEAKILLEKTAIPTLHSHEKPPLNGAGLVNAYKLGEVGKRLKKKCKHKGMDCFQREILKEGNYRFDEDKNLRKDVSEVFPSCAIEGARPVKSRSKSFSCEEKKEAIKRLRKAILLNPEGSRDLLTGLSCIYREGGLSQNSEALDKLALALGNERDVISAVRAMSAYPEDKMRLMLGMEVFDGEFEVFTYSSVQWMTKGMEGRYARLMEKAFDSGDSRLQQEVLHRLFFDISAIGGPDLLEEIGELKGLAAKLEYNIGGPDLWLSILKKALNTGNPDVVATAVITAKVMGKPGLSVLKKALETEDPVLHDVVVKSADSIRGPAVLFLGKGFQNSVWKVFEKALKTSDCNLLWDVFNATHIGGEYIGEDAFLPLLEEVKEKVRQLCA